MKIDIIAGARPNFVKIAPLIEQINNKKNMGIDISYRLVHTGQHYDEAMSNSFFKELDIPMPDINLGVGSSTQAKQTADIMLGYEKTLDNHKPDLCIVVGDVNSTMACSIVAKKMNISIAHIEAGIRSFDMNMPEEINRIITDSITDYFFTTSKTANQNLLKSGINKNKIFFVGNVMIDTLLKQMPNFKKPHIFTKMNLNKNKYIVLTLHRPSNVDNIKELENILYTINNNVYNSPILFPVHPRTDKILSKMNFDFENIYRIQPMSYLEFNYLVDNSACVITDSGGITEETTVLGIPCMTLRNNTERPETVTHGTNEIVGVDTKKITLALKKLFSGNWKTGCIPELWDGKTSSRIVNHILKLNIEK